MHCSLCAWLTPSHLIKSYILKIHTAPVPLLSALLSGLFTEQTLLCLYGWDLISAQLHETVGL